jgi:hypothetical protein
MFSIDTVWFDVAMVMTIFAVGNVMAGHWEVHTPKWRRLLKIVVFTALAVIVPVTFGRVWLLAFLGVALLAVLYVHGIVLPRHGINGWSGEPKEKYYALRGWKLP